MEVAGGETKVEVESIAENDAKDPEKRQIVTSELKKLQFYGAGPKTALPDDVDSGNDIATAADDDNGSDYDNYC